MNDYVTYGFSVTVAKPEERKWRNKWWQFWPPKTPIVLLLSEAIDNAREATRRELTARLFG